jgi:pimeloyl-ACP methyl ester carboxylesterase
MFLAARHLPGFGRGLGWIAGRPRLRRNSLVLGGAFADPSPLDGEFDEFFLQTLHRSRLHCDAAVRLLRSFERRHVDGLAATHRRIDVPVQLVWSDHDPFFPVARATAMVATFPNADLRVIEGAGLFAHEERPGEVAEALLPALTGEHRGERVWLVPPGALHAAPASTRWRMRGRCRAPTTDIRVGLGSVRCARCSWP